MITTPHAPGSRIILVCTFTLALLLGAFAGRAIAAGEQPAASTNSQAVTNSTAGTNNAAGDLAWEETSKALASPAMPAAWQTNAPTPAEEAAFYLPLITKATDKARDFYTRFPDHPKAAEARRIEFNLLNLAVQKYHDTNQVEHLAALRKESIKAPTTSAEDRFSLRSQEVMEAAMAKKAEGKDAVFAELEKGARELLKEFPGRQEVYALLLQIASNSDGDKAKALAKEVMENATADELKQEAATQLKMLEALGKPLEMQYTAVDGRKVDLAKFKGKVVLVDFWATWCGPCVAELPEVVSNYTKYHDRGFEIVGIALEDANVTAEDSAEERDKKLDAAKQKMLAFTKKNDMPWPQFFDGKGWENRIAVEHGIHSIPAMWLVDKKGNLIDLDARGGLEEKISKLIAQ